MNIEGLLKVGSDMKCYTRVSLLSRSLKSNKHTPTN